MSVDDNISIEYGWSISGKPSYGERQSFRSKRLTVLAAYHYSTKELIALLEFEGYTNTEIFTDWFENQLCPELKPGQVVILDNASFHKSKKLKELAEAAKCELLYLPPYSPDLNPIEKFWANLKAKIRKVIGKARDIHDAITIALKQRYRTSVKLRALSRHF